MLVPWMSGIGNILAQIFNTTEILRRIALVENWTLRKRPVRLERRIDFDNYDLTRDFLDLAAELSEKEGLYPDMNFGRTHVNMTIHANDGETNMDESQLRYAQQINSFAPSNTVSASVDAEYHVDRS